MLIRNSALPAILAIPSAERRFETRDQGVISFCLATGVVLAFFCLSLHIEINGCTLAR
jgi:hypothetical protein